MTRGDWIGVAGAIIGLPGLLILFLQTSVVMSIAFAILVLLLGWLCYLVWGGQRKHPFQMEEVSVQLVIHDSVGGLATLRKTYVAIPQYPHLSDMMHRNIGSDGVIKDIKWNGDLVNQAWIDKSAGQYSVCIRFPGPLTLKKKYNWELSYDAENSFSQEDESLYYVVDFPAKRVAISVVLPDGRAPKSAHCFRVEGASKKPIADPVIEASTRKISTLIKKPRVGSEYEIKWKW